MKKPKNEVRQTILGWREYVSLPALGVEQIKAKIDTGAKTCALHAYYLKPFQRDGKPWVRFGLHPKQGIVTECIDCEAPIADERTVTDSGGHSEQRYVIKTSLFIGAEGFDTELTLTNRDTMRFRMLIGRNALEGRFVVDSAQSFAVGMPEGMPMESQESSDDDSASEE